MLKFTETKVIDYLDWDDLVMKTYGKPYSFQQQEDCRDRGFYPINVPEKYPYDIEDSIPVSYGTSFQSWLDKDPNECFKEGEKDWETKLIWHRIFYPDVSMLVNDLYEKGLIEEGKYVIRVDW